MTKTKSLILLLWFLGVSALLALVPVFMPLSWMTATHRWLGLGEMPTDPIAEYLARSLSLFYALFGALCLFMAADLERYRPLVRFMGFGLVLMGAVMLGLDLAINMPWWWSVLEGPPCMVFGALMVFLADPAPRKLPGAVTP